MDPNIPLLLVKNHWVYFLSVSFVISCHAAEPILAYSCKGIQCIMARKNGNRQKKRWQEKEG